MHFPPRFLQRRFPYFSMVHLLHRLYGVDASLLSFGFDESSKLPRIRLNSASFTAFLKSSGVPRKISRTFSGARKQF